MTNYLICRWNGTFTKALVQATKTATFDEHTDGSGVVSHIMQMAIEAQESNAATLMTVGHYYAGQHDKAHWRDAQMMVLECDTRNEDRVLFMLKRKGLNFKVIPTTTSDEPECSAFLVPLDRPVNWKEYIRIATYLASEVKASIFSSGYYRPTFIMRVRLDDAANDRIGKFEDLNVDDTLADAEGEWIVAADFERTGL